ncbi:MAG: lipopolysaccharide biosynthesis protein [Aggregatilineales bacterium]
MSAEATVTKKTVTSTAVTYVSYLAAKGVNLLTTAILARLLTSAEFGIVGFALTAMSFLDAVRDIGLGTAIIQRRNNFEEASHTAFWISVVSNIVIWLVTVAISPLVAAFFHEPLIIIILPILSFSFVISSIGSIHDALLKRDMKFGRRVIPSLGESFVKSVVSVGLALTGGGVWALVAGQLAGRTAFSIIAWRVVPFRPQWRFSRPIGGQLIRYGYKVSIDSFLSALQANIDYVFVGHFLGDVALGIYTIAYRVPELIIINMCLVVAQVLLPTYSILQENMDQLRRGMLTTLRYITLITLPIGVGLALTAVPVTRVLFGAKWDAAGPTMAVLCLYGTVLAISWNIGDIYKAIGRPDILWKTALIEFGLLGPTLFILAQYSVFAVSLGHLTVAIIVTTLRLTIATRTLKMPLRTILAQFLPSVISSAIMSIAVGSVLVLTTQWSALGILLLAVPVGAITYVIALWWLEREVVLSAVGMIRGLVIRRAEVTVEAQHLP